MAWIAALVSALLLVGAGCGGGGDDEAADEPDVAITETTDETTTDDLDTSGLEGLASEDCLRLITIGAAIGQAFSGAGGADGETSELFEELVAKAPDEIKDDLQTVAGAYSEYADALADLDLQEGQVPSAADLQKIQAAIGSIDQAGVQAAAERLSAWAEQNCPSG
jgi:hypothetical protein